VVPLKKNRGSFEAQALPYLCTSQVTQFGFCVPSVSQFYGTSMAKCGMRLMLLHLRCSSMLANVLPSRIVSGSMPQATDSAVGLAAAGIVMSEE